MPDLWIRLGNELHLRFHDLPSEVVPAFAEFLAYFVISPPQSDVEALSIHWGAPETTFLAEPIFVTETEDVRVLKVGPLLRLEAPGLTSWVSPEAGKAWIDLDEPFHSTAPEFAGLILAAVVCELASEQHWWGIHAAAVSPGGRGLLLPAASGSGKSTVLASCAAVGIDVLSDDLVWLRPMESGVRLHAFPRGLPAQPAPPPTMDDAPLAAVVTMSIVDQTDSTLTQVPGSEVLGALLGESGFLQLGQATGERFVTLVRLAESVPCFRLEAGSDREAVPGMLADLAVTLGT